METALFEACKTGRTDVIKQVQEEHEVELDVRDDNGNTPLHIASFSGQVDCVRALLRLGCKVDLKNNDGELAYECGTEEVKGAFHQELLQHVATGNAEGVEALIRCGTNLNQGDGTLHNATLLHWAASFGQGHSVIRPLVDGGANVNSENASGGTPLHEAVANGSFDSAEALLSLGADKSIQDNQGKSPLDLVDPDDSDMMELLSKSDYSVTFSRNTTNSVSSGSLDGDKDKVKSTENEDREESEEQKLRRLLEEKTTILASLRETIATILQEKGILNYVKRLQDEVSDLDRQLELEKQKSEQLTKNHIRSESELETALRDNAILRSAIHDKEQRLLSLLEANYHENSKKSTDSGIVNNEEASNIVRSDESSTLKLERDRLARELENERRQRYEEARIHLAYSNQLRKELDTTRQQLESRARILQNGVRDEIEAVDHLSKKSTQQIQEPQGFFSLLYYAFWGDNDDYDDGNSESELVERSNDEGYKII